MFEDKFRKLKDRIFFRGCRKLLYDFIMNIRSTVQRIGLIESHISSQFSLRGIRVACMLENEN
jgi:hypothetical protein